MPDSIRHFFNLALIFVCLVLTAYVTRMVLSALIQRLRFLYGKKPQPPVTPPPLPTPAAHANDPPQQG